jgi:hypothetical protein
MGNYMSALVALLALSALIGFALGNSFSWVAIAASSAGIAVLSSAIRHARLMPPGGAVR